MRLIAGLTALALTGVLLTACAGTGGGPSGSGSGGSSSTSTPTPTTTAPPRVKPNFYPTYSPTSAKDNQRLFVILMEQGLVSEGPTAQASGLAQRLSGAGFDPAGIQWTDNSTAIGLVSDTVFVSAQVAGECLIGQYGPAIPTLALTIVPALPSGGCLLGKGINNF